MFANVRGRAYSHWRPMKHLDITDIRVAGYERVIRAVDHSSGLHALLCVHDTTMGPALGGLRMWSYASEEEALFDVTRLAKGMTYKSAVAQTGLGGGKAVIIDQVGGALPRGGAGHRRAGWLLHHC
jgi:glutamate dehydrogenase/leucine dehydrogenase